MSHARESPTGRNQRTSVVAIVFTMAVRVPASVCSQEPDSLRGGRGRSPPVSCTLWIGGGAASVRHAILSDPSRAAWAGLARCGNDRRRVVLLLLTLHRGSGGEEVQAV